MRRTTWQLIVLLPTTSALVACGSGKANPLAHWTGLYPADKVCATFKEEASVDCQPCPEDSSKVYCITVRAVQVAATVTDKPLKKIAPGDIAASCP